jgi:hypothetical protein
MIINNVVHTSHKHRHNACRSRAEKNTKKQLPTISIYIGKGAWAGRGNTKGPIGAWCNSASLGNPGKNLKKTKVVARERYQGSKI